MKQTTVKQETKELKGKIEIINKHLKKRPLSKKHEKFLMKRLLISVGELSELEQSELYFAELNMNPSKYN